ncbi:MAG: signal peptidase II [bacterium]
MKATNLLYLLPTAVVIILDQLTKIWIRSAMQLGKSIPIFGQDFFRLSHVENVGVAFGMKAGTPFFLIIFTSIASLFIAYLILAAAKPGSLAEPPLVRFSLSLILGGAIGNLIDRIIFGRVTDFLDFDFPDFIMNRWPVFNAADSAVTIGVTLWCLFLIFGRRATISESDNASPHGA